MRSNQVRRSENSIYGMVNWMNKSEVVEMERGKATGSLRFLLNPIAMKVSMR